MKTDEQVEEEIFNKVKNSKTKKNQILTTVNKIPEQKEKNDELPNENSKYNSIETLQTGINNYILENEINIKKNITQSKEKNQKELEKTEGSQINNKKTESTKTFQQNIVTEFKRQETLE